MRRVGAVGATVLLVAMGFLAPRFWDQAHPPQYGASAVVGADGQLAIADEGVQLYPGTRVVRGAPAQQAVDQRSWLARSVLPPTVTPAERAMLSDALLDLQTLGHPDGVVVAGAAANWRYVWPRDSAFVASALARTGHVDDAERQLRFLQSVQPTDGRFQARYLPGGSGPPDARGVQLDGSGWALWALAEVLSQTPDSAQRAEIAGRLAELFDRSVQAVLVATDDGSRLPPVSADYWETKESELTLATCAVLLMGLRSAESIAELTGQPPSDRLTGAADRFEALVLEAFRADGFPRHLEGSSSSTDLGVALLLPPFGAVQDGAAIAAWRGSERGMRRPAGGLAPGGSWRRDGISWTPTTLTFAMVQACHGDAAGARGRLAWVDAHRTPLGSIPEKVTARGGPAGPAPIAWSAAAAVITADLVARGCR